MRVRSKPIDRNKFTLKFLFFIMTVVAMFLACLEQFHNRYYGLAHLVPVLIVLCRDYTRTERKSILFRFVIATLSFWFFIILSTLQETKKWDESQGTSADVVGDTGDNVAALLIGWLPGGLYAMLLSLFGIAMCFIYRKLWYSKGKQPGDIEVQE